MTTVLTITPPAEFINANQPCPGCPFPDDREHCCHDEVQP